MKTPGLNWGTSSDERQLDFPCDAVLEGNAEPAFRGVDVEAAPAVVFRRLCQLRVAPYSYDWIDNLGRRSPVALTPGLEKLELGQPVMTIFALASFERDRHLTVSIATPRARRVFGDLTVSYLILPAGGEGSERCRLLAKLVFRYSNGPWAWFARRLLPLGDLIMMRKQLLTLKRLAESDARAAGTPAQPSRSRE